jgi:uncharacterized protein with beta-barrel porin domain
MRGNIKISETYEWAKGLLGEIYDYIGDIKIDHIGRITIHSQGLNVAGILATTRAGDIQIRSISDILVGGRRGIAAWMLINSEGFFEATIEHIGSVVSAGDSGIWVSTDNPGNTTSITLGRIYDDLGNPVDSGILNGVEVSGSRIRGLNFGIYEQYGLNGTNQINLYNTVDVVGGLYDIRGEYGDDTINNHGTFTHTGKIDLTALTISDLGGEVDIDMETLSNEDRQKIFDLVPEGDGSFIGLLELTGYDPINLADLPDYEAVYLAVITQADDTTGINNIYNLEGATFNSGTEIILMDPDVEDSSGTFTNHGVLSPGDTERRLLFDVVYDEGGTTLLLDEVWTAGIQTTRLTGNFVQTETGIFTVNVDPETGQSDRMEIIGGSATLDGRLLVIPAKPVVDDPNRYVILTTDGGAITGTFGDTETLFHIPLFSSYEADYSVENEVAAVFREAPTYEQVADKKNHKALTRHGLSTLPGGNNVITYLHRIVEEVDVLAAYDMLTGELHPSISGLLMEDSSLRSDAVRQRLHNLSNHAAIETTYGLFTAGAEAPDALNPNNWWFEVQGSVLEQDANSDIGTADLDHEARGFLIGVDHSNDGWAIGVAFGQTQGETDVDDRLSDADTETWSFGMYGAGRVEIAHDLPLHFSFGAFGNWHEIDASRTVAYDDFYEDLEASYDATSFQAFAEIGRDFELANNQVVNPFAAIAHISMETDGFTETAVGDGTDDAALTADDSSQSLTTTTLGLRSGIMVDHLNLHGMIGWRRNFGDVEPETELSFAESDKFTITGSPVAEDALITELSIGTQLDEGVMLSAIYRGQMAEDAQAHSVNVSLTGRF